MADENENEEYDDEITRKNYINRAEKIVRNTFADAEIFHGVVNNTIAFNKDGLIFITAYGKSKLLTANDITTVVFSPPKKGDFPMLYYCILKINDPEMPEIKFLLSVGEETMDEATGLYFEIETRIESFKK